MSYKMLGWLAILFFCLINTAHAGDPWQNYDDYTVIDHDTMWSGHLGRTELPKPTVVVNGATLTIEKGTTVEVSMLTVLDGRIVAMGTETEPIHFTKQAPDFSRVPADYAPYDRECYFFPEAGMVEFASDATADAEPSVLRHVIFEGMGMNEWAESDNCPWSVGQANPVWNFFVKTVHAGRLFPANPALKFTAGRLKVEYVTFRNNLSADIAIELWLGDEYESFDTLEVTDSNFEGNTENTAVISTLNYDGTSDVSGRVLLQNNWYGTESGPTTASNPGGTGERLIGTFRLDGFSASRRSEGCAADCFSNVLFLPGLEASRLYRPDSGNGDRLWQPNADGDMLDLVLDDDGKSVRDDIYTKDVIDNAYVPVKGNIYESFLDDLKEWRDDEHLIVDYAVAPYDWRLTLEEIVNGGKKTGDHISYTDSTDTPYIISELRRLASTSKSGKVTLIAHSNGGLVAKALTDKLGAEASELIDKIVFVAVPQSGTPQALGAILHGYDQGLPVDWFPFIANPQTARILANNMPSAYHLLPSNDYFTGEGSGVTTPVITFEEGPATDPYIETYGKKIGNSLELRSFLMNNFGKNDPGSNNLIAPSTTNPTLLLQSEAVRQAQDDWSVPAGIELYQIAGFGEETVSTIEYKSGEECLHEGGAICSSRVPKLEYKPKLVVDGDGTVVAPSALTMSEGIANTSRWWVDLDKYNNELPQSLARFDGRHANILEVPGLREFIRDNVIQSGIELPDFISDQRPSINDSRRLRYYLHSPLALSARDSSGRVISASHDTYPGAKYRHFGEVQYISVPADSTPTLILDGLDTGSFTLEIEEVVGEEVLETATFAAIPTTADTLVMMDFPDGTIDHATPLVVDYDGDGTTDFSLPPIPGETVVLDTIAPTTTVTLSGAEGSNDWYKSDVTVTLNAIDEERGSGIGKTEYSLDQGTTWLVYSAPLVISSEAVTVLSYRSTDKQGNQEDLKTLEVKIDRTAPEAKIAFNPTTQKLDITGVDNLAQTVSVTTTESNVPGKDTGSRVKHWFERWFHKNHGDDDKKNMLTTTLTDQAGHRTELIFEKKKDKERRIDISLNTVSYDGESTPASATLRYKWVYNTKKGKYQMLASSLKAGDKTVESHYRPKQNITIIMSRAEEIDDRDEDDDADRRAVKERLPGMVILGIETEKSHLKIKY